MKRLLFVVVSGLVLAGCASAPPPQPAQQPMANPGANNPSGETEPLPSEQAPTYSQNNNGGEQSMSPPGSNYGSNTGNPSSSQSGPQMSSPGQSSAPQAPPRTAKQVSSPAVMSLINRADTLANAGHMEDAASSLERALDLDPRNPFIYQRLAAVRMAAGQPRQAEQLAMKSNSLSNNNPFIEAGNWQLIAQARKATGDTQGASQAHAQAVNFGQSAAQYNQ